MEISGKVIIITGASQGIGLAAARHLSGLGAKLVLAARSKEAIEKLANDLTDSIAVECDMKKTSDVDGLMKAAINKFGRIDILINNAGQGMYGLVEDMDIDNYRQIMELNVYSVVYAMQQVIPIMRKQGGGMIINISSALTKMYVPGISAYSSTKYALNAISLIARQELEKDKISVCIVEPNMTATNFGKNALGKRPDFSASGRQMPRIDSSELVAKTIESIIISQEPEIRV